MARMTRISAVRLLTAMAPGDAPIRALQQACRHETVRNEDLGSAQLAIKNLLDAAALRHRQDIASKMMHLFHVIIAVLVLEELDAPLVEFADHVERALRIGEHGFLINDAIIRDGDFANILLGRREARHDRVVQPIHADGDGAGAFDIGLLEENDLQGGIGRLRLIGGERSRRAAADDEHVRFKNPGAISEFGHCSLPSCFGRIIGPAANSCLATNCQLNMF